MAARKGDTKLLIGATVGVIAAGLLVAAAILLVTGRAKTPKPTKPVTFGVARSMHTLVDDGGPLLFAGTSGDDGFWAAIENGDLVALVVRQPALGCNVKWRGSLDSFTCAGRKVKTDRLDRYRVVIPERGKQKGRFLVDLRDVQPGPAA
jgi:hypothetical protein